MCHLADVARAVERHEKTSGSNATKSLWIPFERLQDAGVKQTVKLMGRLRSPL